MQGPCQPWQPISGSSASQVQSRSIGSSRHLTQPQEAAPGSSPGRRARSPQSSASSVHAGPAQL
eukprot:62812-Pelagomonas_calceolata.AAC.1